MIRSPNADYVIAVPARGQMHRCPALYCPIWVPMHRLACSDHWAAIPQDVKAGLTATRYRRRDRRRHLEFYTQAVRLLTGGAIEGNPA